MTTADVKEKFVVIHKPEFDIENRGKNYRLANDRIPTARYHEFLQMYFKIAPAQGQIIVECGTGNGFLTIPLAQRVGSEGHVYTLDDSASNLEAVRQKAQELKLNNITFVHLNDDYFQTGKLPLDSGLANTVATLATFHHFDEMRKTALKEFQRLLKKDGKIVIGDVEHNTKPQRYFDDFVHHVCSTGHDHRFMTPPSLQMLSYDCGLKIEDWQRLFVPWEFGSTEQMGEFLHTIHDATCSVQESVAAAERYLGLTRFNDRFVLHWELFFATLRVL